MTSDKERRNKLQNKSERLFRKLCNENEFAYMYIDQQKDTFSSNIWKSKRPDFLISVPNISSLFIDVKALDEIIFWKDAYEELDESPPRAYRFEVDEILRFRELEKITSMKVWFIVYGVKDDTVTNQYGMIPNDRIFKFIRDRHIDWNSWNYIQVPVPCLTGETDLAFNICSICEDKYCTKVDKLIEIEDKIHDTYKPELKVKS